LWYQPWLPVAARVALGPCYEFVKKKDSADNALAGPQVDPPADGPARDPPPTPGDLIDHSDPTVLIWHSLLWGSLTVFLLGLYHSERFRRRCGHFLVEAWHQVRYVVWDVPLRIVPLDVLNRVLNSWLFQLVWWVVIQPLAISGVLWWGFPA